MTDDSETGDPGEPPGRANPFWDFSLAVYGEPRVGRSCLQAQEEHGADVNLLLLCCWLGFVGVKLTEESIRRLDALADGWRTEAILPLRALRTRLRQPVGPIDTAMADPVRECVKQAELLAEKVEQDLLYAALQTLPGRDGRDAEPSGLARQNLQLYATAILLLPNALAMKEVIENLLAGCRAALEAAEEDDPV